jgi:hypothetical protein
MAVEPIEDDIYLKAAQVRQRYGNCSHTWIARRQKDACLPAPAYLGGLRFWKLRDLERWERDQRDAPKARPSRGMKAVRS